MTTARLHTPAKLHVAEMTNITSLAAVRAQREAVRAERVRYEREAAARKRAEAGQGHLRLTKRGRMVFGLLGAAALAFVLALCAWFFVPYASATSADAENGAALTQTTNDFMYVVPLEGQTLWQIASEIAPEADPRQVIDEMVTLNQLDSSAVTAFTPLAVPQAYADAPGLFTAKEVGL